MTSWQQQCHLRDRRRWLDMPNNNVINNVNKATGGALNSVRTTYAAYVLKDLFLDCGCIDCRGSITPIATSGGVTSPGLLSPTARTFIFYLLTYCRPTYFYCIRSRPATVVSRLHDICLRFVVYSCIHCMVFVYSHYQKILMLANICWGYWKIP